MCSPQNGSLPGSKDEGKRGWANSELYGNYEDFVVFDLDIFFDCGTTDSWAGCYESNCGYSDTLSALGFNTTLNYREESLEFSLWDPGCHITLPVSSNAEVNLSAFLTLMDSPADDTTTSDDFGIVPSFNLSLSVGPDLDKWAIRPAVGYLWYPDDMHTKWCWSVFLHF